MSDDKQRKAIATACGVTNFEEVPFTDDLHLHWKEWRCTISGKGDQPLPDYLNDLNAMHEAEKILDTQGKWLDYAHTLANVVDPQHNNEYISTLMWPTVWPVLHATAAQRAEAFLRTIGKWKE